MGQKLPRVTGKETARALERVGFLMVRTSGSHAHYRHPDRPGLVTVPMHAGETLFPAILKSILRQAGLSDDAFRELL
jgi:predicted RNA binding protein YcfA (HicA-like mRNA interferase family)